MAAPRAPKSTVIRTSNPMVWLLTAGSIVAGFFTGFSLVGILGVIGIDRFKNNMVAKDELDARARWYKAQIARQLQMNPEKVRGKDLVEAAKANPFFRSVVRDVINRQKNDDRLSTFASVGSIIPVAGGAAKGVVDIAMMAKSAGGALGGTALSMLFNKETVSTQEIAEAIQATLLQAHQQGIDPRQVISAQSLFLLRVSQDAVLGGDIKRQFGKAFHKMTGAEQTVVMNNYQLLAEVAVSEAHAVATGIVPVQELVASAPNVSGMAARFAPPSRAGSFVAREQDRRAMAAQASSIAPV